MARAKKEEKSEIPTRKRLIRSIRPSKATALLPFDLEPRKKQLARVCESCYHFVLLEHANSGVKEEKKELRG